MVETSAAWLASCFPSFPLPCKILASRTQETVTHSATIKDTVTFTATIQDSYLYTTTIHENVTNTAAIHNIVTCTTNIHETVNNTATIHETITCTTTIHKTITCTTTIHEAVTYTTTIHYIVTFTATIFAQNFIKGFRIRAGNSLIGFLSKSLVFAKNERMSDSLKKTNDLLIPSFWWATWAIRSHCSFFMSDLSDFLTVPHLSWAIWVNCSQSLIWFKQNERMSDEQMSKFPALEKSNWLIFGEWPEPFAHSHSFFMSDLSDSLT